MPAESEQDQGTSRRPTGRVRRHRRIRPVDRPARRGVLLVGGTLVLMTGIVMALVVCRSDCFRLAVRKLAVRRLAVRVARRPVSRSMRLTPGTNHALGYRPECKKTPQGEPKQKGPPAEDPPLVPHPATLRRRLERRACPAQ